MALEIVLHRANAPEVKVRGTNIVPVKPGDVILGRSINGTPMLYERPVTVAEGVDVVVIPLSAVRDAMKRGRKCPR